MTDIDYLLAAKGAKEQKLAQTCALIAIAQELRWMNERENRKEWDPVGYSINVNSVDDALEAIKNRDQGDYQSHVYPFGGQP